MSLAEFTKAWRAGEFDDDHDRHGEVISLGNEVAWMLDRLAMGRVDSAVSVPYRSPPLSNFDVIMCNRAWGLEKTALRRDMRPGLCRFRPDTRSHDIFSQMSGRPYGPEKVLEGIAAARDVGFSPLKINVVVQRGINEHTIVETAEHFRGTGDIVRFIEFMDVGNLNDWDLEQVVSGKEIVDTIGSVFPLEPIDANYAGEVAARYRYLDGQGEIGVITSVTQPFCGDCTRARLTTEGRLVTCLFAAGGTDLKGPMRDGATDDELIEIIERVWTNRRDRYSELRSSNTDLASVGAGRQKIEMFRLGG